MSFGPYLAVEGAPLQRLFSTFPARWPGIGLLLIRAAVGLSAAAEALSIMQAGAATPPATLVICGLLVVAGLAILAGFLTPVSAMLVALCGTLIGLDWIGPTGPDVLEDGVATLFVIATSIAIALLGPGAYSFDSYLFGRREIVIR